MRCCYRRWQSAFPGYQNTTAVYISNCAIVNVHQACTGDTGTQIVHERKLYLCIPLHAMGVAGQRNRASARFHRIYRFTLFKLFVIYSTVFCAWFIQTTLRSQPRCDSSILTMFRRSALIVLVASCDSACLGEHIAGHHCWSILST